MPTINFDWLLIIPCVLLSLLGITVLRSVAPEVIHSQAIFMLISAIFFVIVSLIDYRIFQALFLPLYILSILFLITPLVFGFYSHGAVRWLQIGTFSLQPSELIKPFLLMTYATLALSSDNRKFLWLISAGILPILLVFIQPDLGTALVILSGWATIFFSRVKIRMVLPVLFIGLLSAYPIYRFVLHDYQRQRIQTFINPYNDPLGNGYHVIQSVIAVGSGGFLGRGLGHGTQSQLRFLPEHHTDFVFASLAEELGFVGISLLLALFIFLLRRIYIISQQSPEPIAALFCLSVAAMYTFQIFVNIGMNMGIAPITGITLPFISSGGSSLLSLGITLGLVNSISRYSKSASIVRIH